MLTEKTFDTGVVALHYVEGPASGFPLVLLHGATVRWQTFLPIIPLLALRYHIYAVDLHGHGLSGWTPSAYRCLDYTEDIVCFLQEKVKQPAILLGHSLGACMATQAAADAPHFAHALILEEPTPALVSATWEQDRLSVEHPINAFNVQLQAIRDLLRTEPTMSEIITLLVQQMPDASMVDLRAYAKSLSQVDPDVITHLLSNRILEGLQPKALFPRIGCPVLLIQGNLTRGGAVEDRHVAWVTSLLTDCTHIYLENVGHNVHAPQPLTFAQIVTNFIESL